MLKCENIYYECAVGSSVLRLKGQQLEWIIQWHSLSHTAFYYQIGQKMPRDLELYGVMIKCGRVLFKNWLIPTELIEMQ